MEFFDAFPITLYSFDNKSDPIIITHILRRITFKETVQNMVSEWEAYVVPDNETPEITALKFYGDTKYHWLILLFNNITDPFTEWVMDQNTLTKYINKKYSDPDGIHHYEKNGRVVPSSATGATLVTNRQYETTVNEFHRRIRVPKKEHIGPILAELEQILKEVH